MFHIFHILGVVFSLRGVYARGIKPHIAKCHDGKSVVVNDASENSHIGENLTRNRHLTDRLDGAIL